MTTKHKWPALPAGQGRFPRYDFSPILRDVPVFDPTKQVSTSWLIEDFLAAGSIQYFWGEFGTYKSTLLTLAASCVSQGKPFLKMKTILRPVFYFDYENPSNVIAQHLHDLKIESAEMFTIWDRTEKQPPVPGDADDQLQKLVEDCLEFTGMAPWFIFDSWTSLLSIRGTADETRSTTAPIFTDLRRLCNLGTTCTIIDHTNRSKKYYGSEAKMTQMDTSHSITKKDHIVLPSATTTQVSVESFLKRYKPQGIGSFSFEVRAEMATNSDWHIIGLDRIEHSDKQQERAKLEWETLKRVVAENPTSGKDDLARKAANIEDKGNKIMGINKAKQMLQHGIGKVFGVSGKSSSGKQTFWLLKPSKS